MRFGVLLLMVSSVATAQQSRVTNSSTPVYRISGAVVDAASNSPLPKTEMFCAEMGDRAKVTRVVAGPTGRFAFESLPPGKYSISAQRRGYPAQAYDQHEFFATAIAVGPNLDSEHLVFRMTPASSIRGVVKDENEEPVRNAQVHLIRSGLRDGDDSPGVVNQEQTDDTGSFRFPGLQSGSYYLAVIARPWYVDYAPPSNRGGLVQCAGTCTPVNNDMPERLRDPRFDVAYPVTFYPGVTDFSSAAPLVVSAGERAEANIVLRTVRTARVRIHVAAGVPSVSLRLAVPEIFVPLGFNQSDRTAEINGLAPGQYLLQVEGRDPESNAPSYHFEQQINVSGDTDIDASAALAPVTVTGVIVPQFAALPEKASLQIGGASVLNIPLSPDKLTFEGSLLPGLYFVNLMNTPGLFVGAVSGASMSNGRLLIPDIGPVKLRIVVSGGPAKIDGIARENGIGAGGVMVLLVPDDMQNTALVRRDQSDSDGTFTLSNVVPGTYTVVAIRDGWTLKWHDPAVLRRYLASGTRIMVEPHDNLKIQVAVQR